MRMRRTTDKSFVYGLNQANPLFPPLDSTAPVTYVGIAVPCCSTKPWGDANQQCKYDTKCRLSENSGRGQEGPNERGAQLVRRLLGGEEPLDKCNYLRMLSV